MNLILKNAIIVDSKSKFHFQKKDILIESGIIKEIDNDIKLNDEKVISFKNLHVSNGWFDSSVSFGEPGFEERETLENGLKASSKSGFTDIILNPNTNPVIDSHSSVSHIYKKTNNSATKVHVLGSITKQCLGDEMAELYDMHIAGAVAFGDYKKTLNNSNIMRIALDYVQSFNGLIMSYPCDFNLSKEGLMHEGEISLNLGLKGIPEIAETSILARNLEILEYTNGKIHFPFISCEKSLNMIRKAKKNGLNVTCGVSIAHLYYTEESLISYNSNFKIFPPLRTKKDREALRKGLLDGTIDLVSSMHEPINIENKKVEFSRAIEGSIGLESFFGILNNIFTLEKTISFLTNGKNLFNIKNSKLEIGEKACLTMFCPDTIYEFNEKDIISKSKNCAFINSSLKGKVFGIINGEKLVTNSE
ncbi:MAG: dihydroorotase [Flavobacteriaceae bacterium]|mgnify:CR=1 FL=1|nr:dihydroorotase [Flavobacteriaceae bacterium]|tara:strand:+ start:21899 stop:23155 length:1257 start_codon:yes stop_codon:yes gene_type:complete